MPNQILPIKIMKWVMPNSNHKGEKTKFKEKKSRGKFKNKLV